MLHSFFLLNFFTIEYVLLFRLTYIFYCSSRNILDNDSTLRRNYQDDSQTLTPGANYRATDTPMPPPRPPVPPQRLIGI